MISLRLANDPAAEIRAIVSRLSELPRHIGRKHFMAATRRAMKGAVPILRAVTPPVGSRRGRRRKGEKRSTGALRRSVTTKAKYISKTSHGAAYGVVGYKASFESRKAIWLQYGTRRGLAARRMIEQLDQQYAGPSAQMLANELAKALEKATREVASGKNPGRA